MRRQRYALAKDVGVLLVFGFLGWLTTWFIAIASTPQVAP